MVLQQLGDCRVGLWYVQHAPIIELIFDVVHLDLLSLIFFFLSVHRCYVVLFLIRCIC